MEEQENLDSLYSVYLAGLKGVILKLQDAEDIILCKKWLEIFNTCPDSQKLSRNCMISLMYQQLENDGSLSLPFANITNINRDFSELLTEYTSSKYPLDSTNATEDSRSEYEVKSSSKLSFQINLETIPEDECDQIDELANYILHLKKSNEALQAELLEIRKEKTELQKKIKKKDQETNDLLHISRDRGKENYRSTFTDNSNYSNMTPRNKPLPRFRYNEYSGKRLVAGANDAASKVSAIDTADKLVLKENDIFSYLDGIILKIQCTMNVNNPLDQMDECAVEILKGLVIENQKEGFRCKMKTYEEYIQNIIKELVKQIRNYYEVIDLSKTYKNANIQTDTLVCNYQSERSTQTESSDSCKSSSDMERCSNDSRGEIYLRGYIRKLQKSHIKLKEFYEMKLKEKNLQSVIHSKLMDLEITSMKSKYLLNCTCKNRLELCKIANHLEEKYKEIITEAITRFQKRLCF